MICEIFLWTVSVVHIHHELFFNKKIALHKTINLLACDCIRMRTLYSADCGRQQLEHIIIINKAGFVVQVEKLDL